MRHAIAVLSSASCILLIACHLNAQGVVNGDFETGDLSGWDSSALLGDVRVTSYTGQHGPFLAYFQTFFILKVTC